MGEGQEGPESTPTGLICNCPHPDDCGVGSTGPETQSGERGSGQNSANWLCDWTVASLFKKNILFIYLGCTGS